MCEEHYSIYMSSLGRSIIKSSNLWFEFSRWTLICFMSTDCCPSNGVFKYSLIFSNLSEILIKNNIWWFKQCYNILTDDYKGHGNSFHGNGGRGTKRAQMRHCLRLLRSVVSTGDEKVLQDLSDQGAINQITGQYWYYYSWIWKILSNSWKLL